MKGVIRYIRQAKKDIFDYNKIGHIKIAKEIKDTLKEKVYKYLSSDKFDYNDKIKILQNLTTSDAGKRKIATLKENELDDFKILDSSIRGFYKVNTGKYENIPSIAVRIGHLRISEGRVIG